MALQFDTATRTAWATSHANALAGGTLRFFSGSIPASCASPDPSGVLATITLPNPCLTTSNGSTTLAGSWSANAAATGNAACFRGYTSGGTCVVQGNVTSDLVLNNTALTSGQPVSITTYNLTMPGA